MSVRIGTSGWSYDHWATVLYPAGLPPARRLRRYVEEFDTVELNTSFYRWPTDSAFSAWRAQLPEGFVMAVKAHRGLSHYRRLKQPEPWFTRFERARRLLGDRAGPLLVQLHPAQGRDDDRLDSFLAGLPRDLVVALELRHPSWDDPAVFELLRRHRAAYVVTSGAGMRCIPVATAGLVYVRLHGPADEDIYTGSYTDDQLAWWAGRINTWDNEGRDVAVYFNNDIGGHAVRNARALRRMVCGSSDSTGWSDRG